ncbi:hypothetical protein, partial [Pseudomonas syringae]|uniref:hypothetical protein n=1 Tax=Pseudomonas syringae TaxID=317 RepID=UPI0034D5D071
SDQTQKKKLHGIQVARSAPCISHLFFADDSLIFSRATKEEADCLMNAIRDYERASGQLVNLDKSEISFSRNVPQNMMEMIRDRMGVKAVT